jgi:hypothetical protein
MAPPSPFHMMIRKEERGMSTHADLRIGAVSQQDVDRAADSGLRRISSANLQRSRDIARSS